MSCPRRRQRHDLAELYRDADILPALVDSTANGRCSRNGGGLAVVTTDLAAVRAYLPGNEGIHVRAESTDS
jgi:hypothetical protein